VQRAAQDGRRVIDEATYSELLRFQDSDRLTEREKAALAYASAIIWDASLADDALWARLYQWFTFPELVELGFFVALTFGQQKWIATLDIDHGQFMGGTTAGLAPGIVETGSADA
jgi:alkylhydroperoxidase family enzyme